MLNLPKSFSIGFSPFSPCPRRIWRSRGHPLRKRRARKTGKVGRGAATNQSRFSIANRIRCARASSRTLYPLRRPKRRIPTRFQTGSVQGEGRRLMWGRRYRTPRDFCFCRRLCACHVWSMMTPRARFRWGSIDPDFSFFNRLIVLLVFLLVLVLLLVLVIRRG